MISLRPYQDKAVAFAVNNLFKEGNSLIVAGTGAGKTIMLSESIRRFVVGFKSLNNRYPHTLVLVHRTEIHNQNLTKFKWVAPNIPTSEITADRKSIHGLVHFGMVQTVTNLIDNLPSFDLIVIDEAHHSMASTYLNIINKNKEKQSAVVNDKTYILGVSATPNRGDKLPLIDLFNNFYQITTKYLIESHYLVPPKFIDLSPSFNGEKGYLNKNVDWNSDNAIKLIDKLVEDYLSNKEPGKSVIFAPNHKICETIVKSLIAKGRNVAYLENGISDEARLKELERFETGDADELVNVDIATEGYDNPEIRNVVDFDTNGNETQWIQKVGRGLRIAPGKTGCTVLDFGGNMQLYPDVEVEVNLEGEFKAEKGKRLKAEDFFGSNKKMSEKEKFDAKFDGTQEYTPYSLPIGWTSLDDENFGIVYVISGSDRDAIVIKNKNTNKFSLFKTNKNELKKMLEHDEFANCINLGDKFVKETSKDIWNDNKPISKIQIRRLAPKYPTQSHSWHSANCVIAWETWKKEVENYASDSEQSCN